MKTSDLIKKSQSKRGAPGTLKRKIKGKMTISKAKALKNKPDATTLDKKQANFFINMQRARMEEESPATSIGNASVAMPPTARFFDKRSRHKNVMLKRFKDYFKDRL